MNNYVIYKHTNLINGKMYIGKTCQNVEDRYGSNGCGYKACPYFYAAIKKYGWSNFSHEILYSGLSLDEANKKEAECIKKYNSTDKNIGYNIRTGGDGFNSADSKALWQNEEYANKVKETNRKNWSNPEYKERITSRMIESWKDPEKRKRRSQKAKERWANEEFHNKVVAAVKESCKRAVRCVETEKVYDSIVDACKEYNICHSNLIRSIRKGYRSGGVHWKYV